MCHPDDFCAADINIPRAVWSFTFLSVHLQYTLKLFGHGMNNKDYLSALAQETGYAAADTARMLGDVTAAMSDAVTRGDTLVVADFGTFTVKKKLERVIVNPATKQRMLVPPKLTIAFRQAQRWKAEMNGEEQP